MSWSTSPESRKIHTPKGDYTPATDDLKVELLAAARFGGLVSFKVRIDGVYIPNAESLPTNSIAALAHDVTVEPDIAVAPDDRPA